MGLRIKEYNNEYRSAISELISGDTFAQESILGALDKWPEFGVIAEEEGEVVAAGVFNGATKMSSLALYVKPSRRRERIGTLLIRLLEEKMKEAGVEEAVGMFRVNEQEKSFLNKNGYKDWFHSNFMTYSGGKLPESNYEFINYEDKYYEECQKVIQEAFHKMRLSVGLKSTLVLPNEEERKRYNANRENMFILRDNNEIVAAVSLAEKQIDKVAVAVEHQGKGYGRAIVSYAVNKFLDRGCTEVELGVVNGNPAQFLYEKLGFTHQYTNELVVKRI